MLSLTNDREPSFATDCSREMSPSLNVDDNPAEEPAPLGSHGTLRGPQAVVLVRAQRLHTPSPPCLTMSPR